MYVWLCEYDLFDGSILNAVNDDVQSWIAMVDAAI